MRQILRAQTLVINSITNSSCSNSSCSNSSCNSTGSGDYTMEYGCSLALLPSSFSKTERLPDVLQAEGLDPI